MEFLLNILFSKSGGTNRLRTLPIPDCQKCTLNQNVRPIHWTDSQTVTTRPIHYTRLLDRNFVPDCQTVTLYRTAWWVLCTRLPNRYIILNCLMGTFYQSTRLIHYTEHFWWVLCTRLPERYIIPNCSSDTRMIHYTELPDWYFVLDCLTDTFYQISNLSP